MLIYIYKMNKFNFYKTLNNLLEKKTPLTYSSTTSSPKPNFSSAIPDNNTKDIKTCIKLGILDPDLCKNISKSCHNLDNIRELDQESLSEISDEDKCELAWGKSKQEQVFNVALAAKFRQLLYKLKNITIESQYLDTYKWMKSTIPEKLRDHVTAVSTNELSVPDNDICKNLNIKSENCDQFVHEYDKIKNNFNKITSSPINSPNSKTLRSIIVSFLIKFKDVFINFLPFLSSLDYETKMFISEDVKEFLRYIFLIKDNSTPLTHILSINDFNILRNEMCESVQNDNSLDKYNKNINLFMMNLKYIKFYLEKDESNKINNIIDWLIYWQKDSDVFQNNYTPLFVDNDDLNNDFSNYFYDDNYKLNEIIIQKIFLLTEQQYEFSKKIQNEYNRIMKITDTNQKTLELNSLIMNHKTEFETIAINFKREADEKYNMLTKDSIEDIFTKIKMKDIPESIQNKLILGISKIIKEIFNIDDLHNMIDEKTITDEYYRPIVTISPDEVELLNLSFQLQNLRLLKTESEKIEITFPIGHFPVIMPMQKVLFLSKKFSKQEKLIAFHNAIKNQEIHTPIYELCNIIGYYLEVLKDKIKPDDKKKIMDFLKKTKIFDNKIVKIARTLQILAGTNDEVKDINGVITYMGLDLPKTSANPTITPSTNINQIEVNMKSSTTTTPNADKIKEYLRELDKHKQTSAQIIASLKKTIRKISNYKEVVELHNLVRKHYIGL